MFGNFSNIEELVISISVLYVIDIYLFCLKQTSNFKFFSVVNYLNLSHNDWPPSLANDF